MKHKVTYLRHHNARSLRNAGFTLIEAMIVVLIIGVLAAIGYPSYRGYVIKSNRAAAQSYMMSLSSRQEQLMLDQRRYSPIDDSTANAATLGAAPINMVVPAEVSRFYTMTMRPNNAATPPSYTVTAAPISGTIQASDGTMTLDNTGQKLPAYLWK
jgi:type IV pilus assembly protein PilE